MAGAFSMGAGEYTSVASQRELVQAELDVERRELRRHPEDELKELASVYESRGVEPRLALEVARQLHEDPDQALETHAREELGVNPSDLPSPAVAARLLVPVLLGRARPARTAVSAGDDVAVVRGGGGACRPLRVRRDRGAGDGAVVVVQRTAAARAGGGPRLL